MNSAAGTVLWENPTPDQEFAAQTITLSSGDYDYYDIFYIGRSEGIMCERSIKGYGTELVSCLATPNGTAVFHRVVNYLTDTSLEFEICRYGNAGTTVNYNKPIKIIGCKW